MSTFELLGLHIDAEFCRSVVAYQSKGNHLQSNTAIIFSETVKASRPPYDQLLHYYSTVILPVLEYGAPDWHQLLNKNQSDQIETI